MDGLFPLLFVVSGVILVSAMCSLFEAVLYALPIGHIETLAQSGHRSGRILRRLRSDVDRPIAAILSLNTVANTAGAAVAGALAGHLFVPERAWLAWLFPLCFTVAILVFSEVIPKTVGVVYCRPLAPLIAYPLQIVVWSFIPVTASLRLLTRAIARNAPDHEVSDEELMSLVNLGKRSGHFKSHEASVIQNILALESRQARDILTPRTVVFSLQAQTPIDDAGKDKRLLNYSRVPVYGDDREDIVGIVHRRDVFSALAGGRTDVRLEDIMHPVVFVLDTLPLDRLLKEFLERHQHMMVVLDEYGGLAGVVTLEDVLEEILGKEIIDEFDQVTDLRKLAKARRQEVLRHAGHAPDSADSPPGPLPPKDPNVSAKSRA